MTVEPAVRERASWKLMLVFCLIWVGINFTESVSNQVLPLRIKDFTSDPRIIGWILFLNPLFGFIAQPLIGLLSDHVWTPVGRRAFFLIVAAPIVALCLWFVPLVGALWQLTFLVFLYQFFQDILYGSDHPLLADLIPPQQRTLLSGLMAVSMQLSSLFLLKYAMVRWSGADLKFIFWIASCLQILFVCGAAFFLNEKPVKPMKRPKLTFKRYVNDLMGDRLLRRLAICQFLRAITSSAFNTFMVLFAVETMKLPQGEYSSRWGILPIMSIALAIPLGFLVEKFPKQKANAFGFFLMLMAAIFAIARKNGQPNDIYFIAICFGFGSLIMEVTFKPFMTEYFPKDIIGQLSGAMNVFFATGRMAMTLGGGYLVYWMNGPQASVTKSNDYSIIWWVAIATALTNILLILTVPDHRHDERKRAKAAGMPAVEQAVEVK